jgi:hypothetical protein
VKSRRIDSPLFRDLKLWWLLSPSLVRAIV